MYVQINFFILHIFVTQKKLLCRCWKTLLLSPASEAINSGKVFDVTDICNNFWPCHISSRYYPALRTLEQLEESCLPQAGSYRFCGIMSENIPLLRTHIRDVSMSDLKDFLESIRKHSDKIGETAMKQVCVLLCERESERSCLSNSWRCIRTILWQRSHVLASDLTVTAGFQREVTEGRTESLFSGSLTCFFPIITFILSLTI